MIKKLLCVFTSVCFLLCSCSFNSLSTNTEALCRKKIIIDAGHGGVDGGAVGISGVIEKDVNLEISLKLRYLLIFMGYDVIMTRETDVSIHDENATTIRQKKTSDLHNRLKIANDNPSAVFLSIHQNNFHDKNQQGMCFYYSPNNSKSKILATSLREKMLLYLQPDNRRQLKEATSALYLMYNAKNPAILVECGFLSNEIEEKLLQDSNYQSELTLVLLSGLVNTKI